MSAVDAGQTGVVEAGQQEARKPPSASSAYLLVPIILLFVFLVIAVLRSPNLISSAGIGSAIIVATPLILATYALTPIAMAGRGGVDLSVGPLLGFINVGLIQLGSAEIVTSPIAVFVYAIGVGVIYQVLMGLIIIYVRVQPIIVSLSGYLALAGLNLVIMQRPGGVAPEWMMPWGLGTSIFSPVLVILVLATIGWLILTRTAFFGHLRMMGADERAAYTSGVRIGFVRLGAHVIAGVYVGLAALTFTSLISSGDPTQGSTYTLMAVTALVLGGTSLAGGRGGVIGSLLGAVNVYLITYVLATFNFGKVQSFVTDLAYGVILVVSLLLSLILPQIQRRTRGISPFLFFVLLSIVAVGVIIHANYDYSAPQVAPGTTAEQVVSEEAAEARTEAAPDANAVSKAAGGTASEFGTALEGTSDADVFLFEGTGDRSDSVEASPLAKQMAYGGLLLIALLIILRVTVLQAGQRNISMLVFLVALALVVLGIYLVTKDDSVWGPAMSEPQDMSESSGVGEVK